MFSSARGLSNQICGEASQRDATLHNPIPRYARDGVMESGATSGRFYRTVIIFYTSLNCGFFKIEE